MRKYKTVERKVVEDELEFKGCDICGLKTKERGMNWKPSDEHPHGVCSVIVAWAEGYYEPCSAFQVIKPDICPGCFMTHIVPFLKELGVKIEKMDEEFNPIR